MILCKFGKFWGRGVPAVPSQLLHSVGTYLRPWFCANRGSQVASNASGAFSMRHRPGEKAMTVRNLNLLFIHNEPAS